MRHTSALEYALAAAVAVGVAAVLVWPAVQQAGAMLAHLAAVLPH